MKSPSAQGAPPDAGLCGDERFRLLVDAVTDYAIYMLDVNGNVVSWNAGAERFKGYTASEIIGSHFSQFHTAEDLERGSPVLSLKISAEKGKFESEGWRVCKDGTRFWAHVIIDPIRDPSGELLGFAQITRDLSERKQAEQSLYLSQEELRLLVQSVTDYAIYMIDPEGHVASWNAGAERIKGYAAEEIIGRHFSDFYTAADRDAGEPQRALATALEQGRYEKEGQRVRKDGSIFWANVVIDPIRNTDGRVMGFAKITRDISERRQAEKNLEQAREALFQAQKMDAIGQLTGGIAHDFNNLLTVIMGGLELIQKRVGDDPRINALIENAMHGARRGATLTQRMLAFARQQELKSEVIELPALVRGMLDLLDRSLGTSVLLTTRLPATTAPVLADRNQLEMALLNLAVNARDAMPLGGLLTLVLREQQLDDPNALKLAPGRYAVLSVIDQGEGMDAETLRRALEPFFTTKGVGKGTGLGLSMVHGLAQQLGGLLDLKSVPGEGTTADLWIPLYQGTGPVMAAMPAQLPADARRPKLAILAVDDDALVLLNTVDMLEDLGDDVTRAFSGAEALAILESDQPFDLMITDHGMPGMSGSELIEQARLLRPRLRIVLATGYAELPPGAPSVPRLAKPYTQAQLDASVTEVMKMPVTVA